MISIEVIHRSGVPVGDAISTVCLKLAQAGVRMGRAKLRVISKSALRKWREEAMPNGSDRFSERAVAAVIDGLAVEGQWPPSMVRAIEITDGLIATLA